MWQPYIEVIKERAPEAVMVFDRFHIVRHLMDAVDQVRRDEIQQEPSSPQTAGNTFSIRLVEKPVESYRRTGVLLNLVDRK